MALSHFALLCVSLMLIPAVHGECKKKKSDVCGHLDYTMLQFPNIFGHQKEDEALEALKQIPVIASQACDDKIPSFRLFLCQMYFPPCTILPDAVPPCRSVCAAALNNCSASLSANQVSWQSEWACDQFPQQEVCQGHVQDQAQISISIAESVSGKKDKSERRNKRPLTVPGDPVEGPSGVRRPSFQQCVTFQSEHCSQLPYDTAGFPNLMGNRNPQEADMVMASLRPLLATGCSPYLRDFLCSVQFPKCSDTYLVPPCQSLCSQAFTACAGVLRQFGFVWPERLQCNRFPEDRSCYKGEEHELAPPTPQPSHPSEPSAATVARASPTPGSSVDLGPAETGDLGPVGSMFLHPILDWLKSSTNLNRQRSMLAMEEVKLAVLNRQKLDLEISKLRDEQL